MNDIEHRHRSFLFSANDLLALTCCAMLYVHGVPCSSFYKLCSAVMRMKALAMALYVVSYVISMYQRDMIYL